MNKDRYPANVEISYNDFLNCKWKDILSNIPDWQGYLSLWRAFSSGSRQATEEGESVRAKILWLFADICSMALSPKSLNEPFKPFMEMEGRRSVIPDDLLDADIEFLADIVEFVDDNWLKARIADLVWLKSSPRNVKFAQLAIDSYRSISLDTETWIRGGCECWKRALSLARMLKAGAGDRLTEMEAAIFDAFLAATSADGFLGVWLADLLETYGLGRDKGSSIAQKLEFLAQSFDGMGDLHRAREYFSASAEWFKRNGDESKAASMIVALSEGWVKEAVFQCSSENPSHMLAATFYENAIQTYRTIPRSERAAYRVDERIIELRSHLNDSGEKSLAEMGVISTPGIDLTQLIENSREAVRGKPLVEALKAFVNLHTGAKVDQLRKDALKRMRQFPLQSFFSSTMVMSPDGRVIAKKSGMGLDIESTSDDEANIYPEMIRDYGILVNIVVRGDIWPALEVLLLEHRLREADFIGLAGQSPIVPKGRERLFGKALFSGFDRDFVSVLHLLIPQIEHMVRIHLKQAGAKTSNLDKDGIENENGLSTLMDMPEAKQVFGEDLAFELKALFCDAFGPNLRNALAHGLLEEDDCYSEFAIYAWWLGLRLIFNTWWNAAAQKDANPGAMEDNVP
ncbi:DUF4209 domain-containing protein (plasmid) [Methylomonas sp. MED-D]|uniref:DUF4209 domain-containing protein n=1 Tax=Methylomonas sp. MED-D TaxID=3418768 RepID=UPI003D05354F